METYRPSLKDRLIILSGVGALAASSLACAFFDNESTFRQYEASVRGSELFPKTVPLEADIAPAYWGTGARNCTVKVGTEVTVIERKNLGEAYGTWLYIDPEPLGDGCHGWVPSHFAK